MLGAVHNLPVHRRMIDALYTEAMVLADDARSYFDESGRFERDALDPMARVTFSCESLKVTTRLMHVIAWLLTQRAVLAGEMRPRDALDPSRRLGDAPVSDAAAIRGLPEQARRMVSSSIDLHRRVGRLDDSQTADLPDEGPARQMFERLTLAF